MHKDKKYAQKQKHNFCTNKMMAKALLAENLACLRLMYSVSL